MKQVILLLVITALAGCGGVHKARKDARRGAPGPAPASSVQTAAAAPVRMPFASGPLQRACISSDRKARSRELCGCIQAVADTTLSRAQQQVAASFYADPHRAQQIRQSDRAAHEAFWKDYKSYGEKAQRVCR